MTVLWAVVILFVVVLAVCLLVLVMSVRLTLLAETRPKWRARVKLALLCGWVPDIGVYDTSLKKRQKPAADVRKVQAKKKLVKRRSIGPRDWIGLLSDILRRLRFDHLRVDAKVGLDDPADTGALYGMLCPIVYSLGSRRAEIHLEPDFQNAGLDARIDTAIEVRPVALIPPLWQFAWRAFGRRP